MQTRLKHTAIRGVVITYKLYSAGYHSLDKIMRVVSAVSTFCWVFNVSCFYSTNLGMSVAMWLFAYYF
jgi:hypothetical protein